MTKSKPTSFLIQKHCKPRTEAATRLRKLADAIDGALGDEGDEGAGWPESLREIADHLEDFECDDVSEANARNELSAGGILTDSHRT